MVCAICHVTVVQAVPPVLVASHSHDYLGWRSWTAHVNITKRTSLTSVLPSRPRPGPTNPDYLQVVLLRGARS